MLGLVLTTFI